MTMRCPSCKAELTDPDAAFCPRCAAPLGSKEAETTARIDSTAGTGDKDPTDTIRLDTPAAGDRSDDPAGDPGDGLGLPVEEIRSRLHDSGWLDALAAAGLGFVVLLAIGGVLTLAMKLNFPTIGAADPLAAFNAIVIAGLGILGTPIVLDGVVLSVVPLGALGAVGAGVVWAVHASLRNSVPPSLVAAVHFGARVAVPFALLCWFFALVFRFRGQHPVSADAGVALVAGAFWGATFGILGAISAVESLRTTGRRFLAGIKAKQKDWHEGVTTGALMVVGVALIGLAATLLWVIVALAGGTPGKQFGLGDALAYSIYLVAFLPNIIVAIVAISVGAPVDVGARVNLGGELVGPLREYSLASWGSGDPTVLVYLLTLIPIAACVGGGFVARRRTVAPGTMVTVLLIASGVFSIVLILLVAIGPLRLAGVVRGSGYGEVAPDIVLTFLFSFLVSGILGAAGWKLAESTTLLHRRFPPVR
jgi:hypothetical protein